MIVDAKRETEIQRSQCSLKNVCYWFVKEGTCFGGCHNS